MNQEVKISKNNLPKNYPVLVTGANGGIGREICRALALLRIPVIMSCRSERKFADTFGWLFSEAPEADVTFLPLDLNSSHSVTEAVNRLRNRPLAGIINNAGVMQRLFELSADGPETTMNVNYHNTKLLNQLLLPQVVQGGTIVFTTSLTRFAWKQDTLPAIVTEKSFGQLKTYSLSKAHITRFASEFASLAEKREIRVNCADPGIVDSSMITMHRWFDPLANVLFRPFIRTPRNGAVPAIRALMSDVSRKIYTLRGVRDL